jgi:hypothetical protein
LQTEDDAAYGRSVRNMAIVLAAMAMVIVVALAFPLLIRQGEGEFVPLTTVDSPYGFVLSIHTNETVLSGGVVNITAWMSNGGDRIIDLSAASDWAQNTKGLSSAFCSPGWPLGIGVAPGYLSYDNYSLGSFAPHPPSPTCPSFHDTPTDFILQPGSSTSVVKLKSSVGEWKLAVTEELSLQVPGVYTVIAADEWGDIALIHVER